MAIPGGETTKLFPIFPLPGFEFRIAKQKIAQTVLQPGAGRRFCAQVVVAGVDRRGDDEITIVIDRTFIRVSEKSVEPLKQLGDDFVVEVFGIGNVGVVSGVGDVKAKSLTQNFPDQRG